MSDIKKFSKFGFVQLALVCFMCGSITLLWLNLADAEQPKKEAISRAAFKEAYKVFQHPRCMNCHPAGKAPLQFNNSVPHSMRVHGGSDGKGVIGMKCSSCHQKTNGLRKHMPPGAPNWHLPHPKTPMIFQNKTPAQLAQQLKDPKQNGGKTLKEIFHHVSHDPLVLWGWKPGKGRTTPPLSHAEFVRKMKEWIENGAVEPK